MEGEGLEYVGYVSGDCCWSSRMIYPSERMLGMGMRGGYQLWETGVCLWGVGRGCGAWCNCCVRLVGWGAFAVGSIV